MGGAIHRSKRAAAQHRPSIPHQLVERDGQIAHALAGGVIVRIGDRGRGADNADLADAFDAERIDLGVLLLEITSIACTSACTGT
jgi:hypothetical protein